MGDLEQYYRILNLKPPGNLDQVNAAYKKLVQEWHPDKFQSDSASRQQAEIKMREINEAYDRVKDWHSHRRPANKSKQAPKSQKKQVSSEPNGNEFTWDSGISPFRKIIIGALFLGPGKLLFLVVSLAYLIWSYKDGGLRECFETLGGLFCCLVLIWFGDELGSMTGPGDGPTITSESPGWLVRILGWFFLFLPVIVYLAIKD